jgi:hypothetical protein
VGGESEGAVGRPTVGDCPACHSAGLKHDTADLTSYVDAEILGVHVAAHHDLEVGMQGKVRQMTDDLGQFANELDHYRYPAFALRAREIRDVEVCSECGFRRDDWEPLDREIMIHPTLHRFKSARETAQGSGTQGPVVGDTTEPGSSGTDESPIVVQTHGLPSPSNRADNIVAELRRRANELEAETLAHPGQEVTNTARHGEAHGFFRAADMVAADPLYRASPAMLALIREWSDPGHVSDSERRVRCDELLATLPKE